MKNPDYFYKCRILRCVDGDTVDAEVDTGFYNKSTIRFRLYGINTPERGRTGYREATEALESMLLDKDVRVQSTKTGKFGRFLGTFYVDDRDINAEMILLGHAVPYMKDK